MTRTPDPAPREPLPGLAELLAMLEPPGASASQALAALMDRIEADRETRK